jgi:hypothetical protein
MKLLLSSLLLVLSATLLAQPDTEVYLFDLSNEGGELKLTNPQNISNKSGYDNQPYFYNDHTVVFSSTINGQTDIASYNIKEKTISYLSNTVQGSEYSPTRIPGQAALSAIRLDTIGLQRLYKYDLATGTDTMLIDNLVIGYHTWVNDHTIASFVLGDPATLVVRDLKKGVN